MKTIAGQTIADRARRIKTLSKALASAADRNDRAECRRISDQIREVWEQINREIRSPA